MDDDLQRKREAIKKQIIDFGQSAKAKIIFFGTILLCSTGAVITLFLGDAYDFLNLCFTVPCIWMAALRLVLFRMEFPESRLFRWSLRFVLVLSIANSILLIMHLVRGQ